MSCLRYRRHFLFTAWNYSTNNQVKVQHLWILMTVNECLKMSSFTCKWHLACHWRPHLCVDACTWCLFWYSNICSSIESGIEPSSPLGHCNIESQLRFSMLKLEMYASLRRGVGVVNPVSVVRSWLLLVFSWQLQNIGSIRHFRLIDRALDSVASDFFRARTPFAPWGVLCAPGTSKNPFYIGEKKVQIG